MTLAETALSGVFVVEPNRFEDNRGFFARVWCGEEFGEEGLMARPAQINLGHNRLKGTTRGMHLQSSPHEEAKLVMCTRGAVFDVAVDLRSNSPTYGQWVGKELSADNRRMLYISEGIAHGYQCLADNSDIVYLTSHAYHPGAAIGVRFDDPALGIDWPLEATVISEQDRTWPLLARF